MSPTDDVRNATLVQRRDLDKSHTVFTVRPDTPVQFTAGQWTEMGLPKAGAGNRGPSGDEFVKDGVVRRAYSICSAPGGETLKFFFNKVEEGQLTRWLWELQPGDRLYVDPEARGHFTLDAINTVYSHAHDLHCVDESGEEKPDILFVATGTGLAPFMSILENFSRVAATGEGIESASASGHGHVDVPWRQLVLIHGTRHEALLACREEIEQVASDPRFRVTYIPTLSREPEASSWNGQRGRVTEVVRAILRKTGDFERPELDLSRCHAYLCGNATMIAAVEGELMPHGLVPRWQDPAGTIHTEVYY